ncbi:MAG: PH domain-containing protein, partial [Clostridia bacterium]
KSEFFVAYDDVETVALLTEPPALSRSVGSSLTYLEKGKYKVRGYGSCRICLDRRDPAILVLETEAETYLISFKSKTAAETVIGRIDIVK